LSPRTLLPPPKPNLGAAAATAAASARAASAPSRSAPHEPVAPRRPCRRA
jgi:hypothetical protein